MSRKITLDVDWEEYDGVGPGEGYEDAEDWMIRSLTIRNSFYKVLEVTAALGIDQTTLREVLRFPEDDAERRNAEREFEITAAERERLREWCVDTKAAIEADTGESLVSMRQRWLDSDTAEVFNEEEKRRFDACRWLDDLIELCDLSVEKDYPLKV